MSYTATPAEAPSATACLLAEESLCNDVDEFSQWLTRQVGKARELSVYFGPISTGELVAMLLNPAATTAQAMNCRAELRERYLRDFAESVERKAQDAMEP